MALSEQNKSTIAKALIDIPIVVLAGGMGTRLTPVIGDRPKILAPIGDFTFLQLLLLWLKGRGATEIIFSLGYQADRVVKLLPDLAKKYSLSINYVIESSPIGTLGGLSTVLADKSIEECLVINGDTYVDIDLLKFLRQQQYKNPFACLSAVKVRDVSRYGQLELADNGLISCFLEKEQCGNTSGWINAGVYYFSAAAANEIRKISVGSLERDFFEEKVNELAYYKISSDIFIDIGTPASYSQAKYVMRGLME